MATAPKKRKYKEENRVFNVEWEENYAFTIHENKFLCLICYKLLDQNKGRNAKRHYETIDNTSIDFADILSYNYNQEMTVGKFNVSHVFGNFYLQGNFNTANYNSIEVGYYFQF